MPLVVRAGASCYSVLCVGRAGLADLCGCNRPRWLSVLAPWKTAFALRRPASRGARNGQGAALGFGASCDAPPAACEDGASVASA
jgi:hypothetical protein